MNEERMDMVLEAAWDEDIPTEIPDGGFEGDEGEVGADNTVQAPEEKAADAPEQKVSEPPVQPERAQAPVQPPRAPNGVQLKEHPMMQQVRENARKRDMARFIAAYPGMKANDIPRQVWEQVDKGVPMISAYAMYENTQLRAQLAAERQNRANQKRTPGGLGSNSGGELDELDRMWAEED